MRDTAAVILAAGKSTRMGGDQPKVLSEVCGRPMLAHVLSACRLAGADRVLVVIGHGKEQVMNRFGGERDITWVEQPSQRGTADAVNCCREALSDFVGNMLILAGDMPLVRRSTLVDLLAAREAAGDVLTLATAVLEDPTGYGRIIRDGQGELEAIVEELDCTPQQREIHEVNISYYCFAAPQLWEPLDTVLSAKTDGEYYLPDVVRTVRAAGLGVSAGVRVAPEDALGINSRLDLAVVNRIMQDRIQLTLMNEGVTIVDPDKTWIESDVSIGQDTVVHPFTLIGTGATIAEGCCIGPFAHVPAGENISAGSTVGPVAWNGAAVT